MGVIIESIQSYDDINGASDKTNFLAANQSSVQYIDVNIRLETYLIAQTLLSADFPDKYFIQANARSQFTGKKQDNRTIHTNKVGGFEGFNVGDTYVVTGTSTSDGAGTILEISEDQRTLITDQTYSTLETFPLDAIIGLTTPQTAVDYLFNLIENQEPENYTSKVDGDTQNALVGGLDYTDTVTNHVMTFLGNKSWQFGSITVTGNGTGNGDATLPTGVVQAFTITHEILVNPLMLFDEWDDIQARIKPERLIDGNSLKYILTAGVSSEENNPNGIETVIETEILGNVGWFNENLNGKPNNYTFSTPVYKRLDATINPSLELTTTETTVEFSVFNTTDSPFSNTNSKVIVGFNFAPSDSSQYRDIVAATSQTQDYNFIFDRVVETLGSGGTATPRQFGTDLQVIKSVTATLVSSSQIDVVVSIEMASDVVSRVSANVDQRYMLYVEVADHTLTRDETDKVQLLLDATDYYNDFSDDGMIVMSQSFLTHPFSDVDTETKSEIDIFAEGDLLNLNDFYLDKVTRETDEVQFTGITSEIIARKNTGASFVLDSQSKNLSAFSSITDPTYGAIPNTNFTESRGFRTPVDDNRANTKLIRMYDLDAAGLFYYRSQFPTYIRWDDYTALTGVNDEFFDSNEPNDGFNNDWIRYGAPSDWTIYYRTTLTALKNGNPLSYQAISPIYTHNYTAGDEWDTEQIKSFDENDVELTGFGIKYADGKLQANFTFIGVTPPVADDIVIDFHIYVYQEGTFKSLYTMSSAYDAHPDTLFKSIDSSNRVVVTNPSGAIWRGEVLTDSVKMSDFDKSEFQVSALIYDKRDPEPPSPPAVPKLMEDGTNKIMNGSSTFKIME